MQPLPSGIDPGQFANRIDLFLEAKRREHGLRPSVAADPRTLFQALEAALAPSDLELSATSLDRFVELAVGDSDVGRAVAEVRAHLDHGPRETARTALYRLLAARGLGVDHAFSSALNHRLLRSGVDPSLDHLLLDMLKLWRAIEERLGIAIDLRVFGFLAARDPSLGPRIVSAVRAVTGSTPTPDQVVGVLAGLLWPRPAEMRARFFDGYSPFRESGHTDPTLIRRLLLSDEIVEVELADPDWQTQVQRALAASGSVRIVAALGDETALHVALIRLIATPIDLDFLQFFPAVDQLHRDQTAVRVTLVLREVA